MKTQVSQRPLKGGLGDAPAVLISPCTNQPRNGHGRNGHGRRQVAQVAPKPVVDSDAFEFRLNFRLCHDDGTATREGMAFLQSVCDGYAQRGGRQPTEINLALARDKAEAPAFAPKTSRLRQSCVIGLRCLIAEYRGYQAQAQRDLNAALEEGKSHDLDLCSAHAVDASDVSPRGLLATRIREADDCRRKLQSFVDRQRNALRKLQAKA